DCLCESFPQGNSGLAQAGQLGFNRCGSRKNRAGAAAPIQAHPGLSDAEQVLSGNAVTAAIFGAYFVLAATFALAEDIGGTGRIEPGGGVVALNGVQGARILSIGVRPGQMVKRGDLLMTLDDREQRANEQIAELALAQARKDA